MERFDGIESVGCAVYDDGVSVDACCDAVVSEADGFNMRRHGQACHDEVFAMSGLCGSVCPCSAVFEHVGGGILSQVVNGECVRGGHHVFCHGFSHVSESDPTDVHEIGLSYR